MNPVEQLYDRNPQIEWERLDHHRTEFAVSLRTLQEFLPPPPASVLDVGGGPGRYAIALAGQGYTVTLVDLSTGNLALAKEKAAEAGVKLAGIWQGNALNLAEIPDASYEAVLVMGPLYHLLKHEERVQALREARRVLHPSGKVFAAFITRFAMFRDVAKRIPEFFIENHSYAERVLATGIHDAPHAFTHAHFAHPDEVVPLMEEAGFEVLRLTGVEGVVAGNEEKVNAFEGEAWEMWVNLNYRVGLEPSLFGASDHLLCVGQKAGQG